MTDLAAIEIDELTLVAPEPEEFTERWVIEDDGGAKWAGDMLHAYEAKVGQHHAFASSLKGELKARYEAKLKEIEDCEDAAVARELPHIERFRGLLLEYFRHLREDNKDLKTYYLPGVTLTRRPGSKKLDIRDEQATIAWLVARPVDDPQRLALKASVLKSNLLFKGTYERQDGALGLVTKDGELIPGVVQVVGEEKFDVKLEADEDEE